MKKIDAFLVLCPLFHTKLPPLGLAYLAEYLEHKGVRVKCFDLNIAFFEQAEPSQRGAWNIQNNPELALSITKNLININNPIIKGFLDEISEYKPEIIGFSLFKSNQYPTFELLKLTKKCHKNVKIVCGGPEMEVLKQGKGVTWLKNTGIDVIIVGEGEQALANLASNSLHSNELIIYKNEEIKDLDEIPYPSFSHLDQSKYRTQSHVPILMSRGCIKSCGFCSERLLYKGYRVRSAAHVMAEIIFHREKGIRSFVFHDSLINGDLKALQELCDVIIRAKTFITWEAQCIIRRDMPVGLLKKMKQAGCYNLFIGLESASDPVLKRMGKRITSEDAKVFFGKLREAGLHFEISLITAFPQETEEEFEETCAFIRKNKDIIPKIAQLNPYVPYDGTTIGDANPIINDVLGKERVQRLVALFEEVGIPYTKSYIGNLIPK